MSLNLLELPTELLAHICNSAEDQDLPNLRLVCGKLCDAATKRFAMTNFTERVHVISPYSIDTLVNITEHPVFGEYVRIVAICSARRTNLLATIYACPPGMDNRSSCLNVYMKTTRFARRMERIFKTIRSRHGSVTISIYDNPGRFNFGMDPVCIPRSFSMLMRCCGWAQLTESLSTSISYRIAETLEETIYAARRARCPVDCLKINIFAVSKHNQLMHEELDEAMRRVLESSLSPLNIDLGGRNTCQISYDHELQDLKFRNVNGAGFDYSTAYLGMRASYTWLLTQRVTQLCIVDTPYLRVSTFRPFFSFHLRRLKIGSVSADTEHFDRNLWSEIIEIVSGLSGLQHCELGNLTYRFNLTWNPNDDDDDFLRSLVLPGHGEYPWSGLPYFRLLFPDGATTIGMDGEDTCEKLHDLASYMRAAEDSKRRKIISDGFIQDDIVGVDYHNAETTIQTAVIH